MKFNAVKFNGATTSGEIRELCGLQADFHDIGSISEKYDCIPKRLTKSGYKTSGYHYFYKTSFNRDIWWPKIGFSEITFLDYYINNKNRKTCGGFLNGGCDRDLISDLFDSIDNKSKSFSYALTLNSHLPVYPNHDILSIERTGVNGLEAISPEVKLLVNSWRIVLQEVAWQLNKNIRDDILVVIVGDHAPPYLNKHQRSMFSKTEVPYIVIGTNTKNQNYSRD